MKSICVALVLTAGLSISTFAAGDQGFYVGVDGGQSHTTLSSPGYGSDHINASELQIFGGYKVNGYVAAELGYRDFGKKSFDTLYGTDSLSANAVQLSGKLRLPVDDRLAFYGRAGFAYIHGKDDLAGSVNKAKPMIGAGLEFIFSANYSLTAEWDYYDKFNIDAYGDSARLTAFSLGLQYTF